MERSKEELQKHIEDLRQIIKMKEIQHKEEKDSAVRKAVSMTISIYGVILSFIALLSLLLKK